MSCNLWIASVSPAIRNFHGAKPCLPIRDLANFRIADPPEVIRPVLRQLSILRIVEHPSAIGLSNQLGRFVFCPSPITSGYSWLRTSQNTIPRASAATASAATVEGAV